MPTTVPNRPTYGRQRADRADDPDAALQVGRRLLARRRDHALEILERDVLPAHRLEEDLRDRLLRLLAERARAIGVARDERLDRLAGQRARARGDPAVAPEPLEEDREHEDGCHRERVDGEPAVLQKLEQMRAVQRNPPRSTRRGASRLLRRFSSDGSVGYRISTARSRTRAARARAGRRRRDTRSASHRTSSALPEPVARARRRDAVLRGSRARDEVVQIRGVPRTPRRPIDGRLDRAIRRCDATGRDRARHGLRRSRSIR